MQNFSLTRQMRRLDGITSHPQNYNQHPEAQLAQLMESLRQFGQMRPIVVWRDWVLAGNGLSEAARRLGWEEIDCNVWPDEVPEHVALAYMVADNQHATNADPDKAALLALTNRVLAEDAALLAALGFDEAPGLEQICACGA